MRSFLALVSREISERKALLAAAAVASLLPVLAPLLPSTGSNPASDIREAVMWVVLGGLAPLFALLLGVGFIGRDLAEGRMGFYYAQPLSGPTIWFGKLTAVVVLIWAVEIIIMLPTVLLSPDPMHFFVGTNVLEPLMPKWLAPLNFWIASVAVVLLAHAIGIVWRARSAWLVLDLIASLIVIGVSWSALSPFLPLVAPKAGVAGILSLVAGGLVGLIIGGAFQITAGRVDLRRCHHALSLSLWTILGTGAIMVFAWSHWIRSATIEALDSYYQISLGSGEWVAVNGISKGRMDYYPRFLLNVDDGRSLSIDPAFNWNGSDLEFSADGSRAVWVGFSAMDHWPVMYADLGESDPEELFTGVVLGTDWGDVAVSADGSRVAVLENNTVAVYQIDPPEQLMAAKIDDKYNPLRLRFDDLESVRVLASSSPEGRGGDRHWHLFFADLESRRMIESAEFDSPWRWGSQSLDGKLPDRLARVELNGEEHLVVLGSDHNEVVADLGANLYWSEVRIMGDGRIVIIRAREDDCHIDVYSPEGSLIHQIDLPEAEETYFGGEVAPDQILIGLVVWEGEMPQRTSRRQTSLVDLRAGSANTILKGRAPVLGRWGALSSPGAWDVGSTAGRLFRGDDCSLSLWNPKTNDLKQLIPVQD